MCSGRDIQSCFLHWDEGGKVCGCFYGVTYDAHVMVLL